MHPLKILFLFPTAYFGRHTGFRGSPSWKERKIEICSASPRKIHRDGEYGGTAKQVTFEAGDGDRYFHTAIIKNTIRFWNSPVISDGVSVCYILIMCLICN